MPVERCHTKIERDLSNIIQNTSISGVKFSLTTIYIYFLWPVCFQTWNHWMSVLPFFPEGYAPRRATWWMDAADAFWRYLNNLVENVDGSSRRQPTRQTDFVLKLWLSTVTCAGLVTKQDETSRTQEAVPKQISNPFSRKRVHFFGKRTHKNMYSLPSKWMLVFLLQILYILREECTLFPQKNVIYTGWVRI